MGDIARIYLSGPITGTDDYRERFAEAESELRRAGYHVVNPAELSPDDATRREAMATDIAALLECDGVALMDGARESEGSRIEAMLADYCGIRVMGVGAWVALMGLDGMLRDGIVGV